MKTLLSSVVGLLASVTGGAVLFRSQEDILLSSMVYWEPETSQAAQVGNDVSFQMTHAWRAGWFMKAPKAGEKVTLVPPDSQFVMYVVPALPACGQAGATCKGGCNGNCKENYAAGSVASMAMGGISRQQSSIQLYPGGSSPAQLLAPLLESGAVLSVIGVPKPGDLVEYIWKYGEFHGTMNALDAGAERFLFVGSPIGGTKMTFQDITFSAVNFVEGVDMCSGAAVSTEGFSCSAITDVTVCPRRYSATNIDSMIQCGVVGGQCTQKGPMCWS